MYAPNLRRAGAVTRPGHPRRVRPLGTGRAPPASQQRGNGAGNTAAAGGTRDASTAAVQQAAAAESNVAGWGLPSASSVAGAVALVPVVGGAWLVTVYALRQRLCEHHLQQVHRCLKYRQGRVCLCLGVPKALPCCAVCPVRGTAGAVTEHLLRAGVVQDRPCFILLLMGHHRQSPVSALPRSNRHESDYLRPICHPPPFFGNGEYHVSYLYHFCLSRVVS